MGTLVLFQRVELFSPSGRVRRRAFAGGWDKNALASQQSTAWSGSGRDPTSRLENRQPRHVAKTHFPKMGFMVPVGHEAFPSCPGVQGLVLWAPGLVGREAPELQSSAPMGFPGAKWPFSSWRQTGSPPQSLQQASNLPASQAPSLCKQCHPQVLPY